MGEVAALLHEVSKLDANFILSQLKQPITNPDTGKSCSYSTFMNVPMDDQSITISEKQRERFLTNKNGQTWVWKDLEEKQREVLRSIRLSLCQENYTLPELLTFWHWLDGKDFLSAIGNALNYEKNDPEYRNWLVNRHGYALWLLDICHGNAQVDKAIEKGSGSQQASPLWVASAFGYEHESFVAIDLTKRLNELMFPPPGTESRQMRNELIRSTCEQFPHALGDTQRPLNEITLWDWSWSTAALYKSALARLNIEYYPFIIDKLPSRLISGTSWKWRTLRIFIDRLGFLAKAHRLSDVLGYERAITKLFRHIKKHFEVEAPLGNEIYQDSTGIYFTFPAFTDDTLCKNLCEEVRSWIIHMPLLQSYPELTPLVDIGETWGQHADPQTPDDPPKWLDAPQMLAKPHGESLQALASGQKATNVNWEALWQQDQGKEICPVCGLRPLSSSRLRGIYRQRRCNSCEQRAHGALTRWKVGEKFRLDEFERETLWIDEIADQYDRVALIVGHFHLDHWLDGKMISTMLVKLPNAGQGVFKEPSPARLQRIWQTTKEFWDGAAQLIAARYSDKQADLHCQRWIFTVNGWNDQPSQNEEEGVLDGTLDGLPISLYPLGGNTYVTISNLAVFKNADNLRSKTRKDQLRVRQGNGAWRLGTIARLGLLPPATAETRLPLRYYQPTRTILTTPDQFLALVPASDALAITQEIAQTYEQEMSKVRSRLPLDLSLIYFHRKMPLYAVMDAARRFLSQTETAEECWIVKSDHQIGTIPIRFTNDCCWNINTSFGDGSQDDFYPYVGLWDMKATGEYTANGRGYVHVKHLQPGQEIAVAPSHFSYLWLDNSTRRYSIGEGTANPQENELFSTQFQHLEEIAWHTATWEELVRLQKLSDTALHGVIDLLLEKRQAWKGDEATFEQFANDVLMQSELRHTHITDEDVTSGRLFRCFDLYRRIMKRTLHDDRQPLEHEKETTKR